MMQVKAPDSGLKTMAINTRLALIALRLRDEHPQTGCLENRGRTCQTFLKA